MHRKKEIHILEEKPSLQKLIESDALLYKQIKKLAKEDLDAIANRISVEVAFALSEKFPDLNVQEFKIRRAIHRMAIWVLQSLLKTKDRCAVIPDGLPGFTVVGFKRIEMEIENAEKFWEEKHEQYNPEAKAAALIIENFLKSQEEEHHIVVIESPDLLMILFSVDESKENLRKLGLM